jgi:UDPglucose--hexose-1-phosphate uridylyltransferase
VEFYPPLRSRDKLKYLAGTEIGAGTFAMDALPENTARELREVRL